jgi:glutathione S-transferase
MNQDRSRREQLLDAYLACWARLDKFLGKHGSADTPWLFDRFGWAEAFYTPFFGRFVFVDYYEQASLPDAPEFARVKAWRDACLAHPSAQQTCAEEVIKLYYDYARGAGNGALLDGRRRSSFAFEPDWRTRPWPPKDKYGPAATDEQLGLS